MRFSLKTSANKRNDKVLGVHFVRGLVEKMKGLIAEARASPFFLMKAGKFDPSVDTLPNAIVSLSTS
jgi:hypothetical protein